MALPLGPSIVGRTCAFVRTVRGFWDWKWPWDKGLGVQKCGYEIAEKRHTVRAAGGREAVIGNSYLEIGGGQGGTIDGDGR